MSGACGGSRSHTGSNLNVPNVISVARILLVPVFLYFVLVDDFYSATVVFVVAGVSDAVDGFIARFFGQRTEFGAHIDPVADKLLILTAFVALTYKGYVPLWLCSAVVFRDVVTLGGVLVLRASGKEVAVIPSIFGKLSTFLQLVTVVYVIALAGYFGPGTFTWLAGLTSVVTVYAGLDYAIREYRVQRGDFQ